MPTAMAKASCDQASACIPVLEYSSLVNGWHGAAPFTTMNQPLLPEFADPANDLVGFGPAGMVGTAGPVLAGAAFSNFTHTGTYPVPSILKQFPLGFTKRNFPYLLIRKGQPGNRQRTWRSAGISPWAIATYMPRAC